MTGLAFDVLIDDALSNITSAAQLKGLVKKRVLSLVNDFEDAKWRYPKFKNFLWDNIAQTALSQRERASPRRGRTGSQSHGSPASQLPALLSPDGSPRGAQRAPRATHLHPPRSERQRQRQLGRLTQRLRPLL